jgi:hypothetical protein
VQFSWRSLFLCSNVRLLSPFWFITQLFHLSRKMKFVQNNRTFNRNSKCEKVLFGILSVFSCFYCQNFRLLSPFWFNAQLFHLSRKMKFVQNNRTFTINSNHEKVLFSILSVFSCFYCQNVRLLSPFLFNE